ncbi:MAG: cation-translocating P-type ATPase, partial [Gammaproteobacteria bacterium]|nr:cation-translocating P-type ATPase [Gammaproteobacteria bacterium]
MPEIGTRSQFWIGQTRALAKPGSLLTIITGFGILMIWIFGDSADSSRGRLVSILTIGLALTGAAPIFIDAARGLFERRSNVDELVSIAVIAALVGGEALAAAVVAFMMNFGKMLEDLAEYASGNAVSGLLELTPVVARIKTNTGYRAVPAGEVSRGDVVLVREGERAPVDGDVITGSASIDQSGITGESVPVRREIGGQIYAGTVNVEGVIEIRATETGESTTVSRIVELVEAAKKRPAPVERLAERYAKYFTPAILLIAGIVLVITQDWRKAIAVLIVACPCSLVLATPTALVAGIARAAMSGILVRGGDVIEALARVTIVAFDKTGTITQGHPHVEEVVKLKHGDERHIIKLAASAEMLSSHPLARAFQEYAQEKSIGTRSPSNFEAVPGRGVVATVSDQIVTVGSHYLLEDPTTPDAARPVARDLRAQGFTCLTVGIDGDPAALVATRDGLRPGAQDLILDLANEGIQKMVLLTGDNHAVASLIAGEAGIAEVHAGLLPGEKLAKIE